MKIFLPIFAFLLFLSAISHAIASEQESATVKMRFFPLAPRSASPSPQPKTLAKELKFYPLTAKAPRTFALAPKVAKPANNQNITAPELPPENPESKPLKADDKKAQMSPEQAKQILSLFAENR